MMLDAPLRLAATRLLESATRIAPPDVRDWGQAMLAELRHVESGWAATAWALGGAGVLAKHALVSLLIPGRRAQSVGPDGGLFAKNVTWRKVAFVASGAYVLAALLFFAAPPFRQGLRVSLAAWNALFHVTGQNGQPRLQALAQRAEARHDPEALAFVAARLTDANDSARLAEEAVHTDSRLLWVYAVVAVRHPELPDIRQWIPRLEGWEPQNALFPLIAAESIDINHVVKPSRLSPRDRQNEWDADPAWQKAMASAFASPNFDDYLGRLEELDRRVARRYRINDPQELLSGEEALLPTYAFSDAQRFAESLLQSGESLEARGDRERAAEKFWTVARFGQLIDSQAHTSYEHQVGASLQAMAYEQLRVLSGSEGNAREAALFAYLGRKFDPVKSERERQREWVFGSYISRRNAAVLQISSLMMLIFSGLLVVAASVLIAGNRQRQRSRRSRRGVTVFVALTSAVGLLLSSATLYLTYRPYWYILQGAILKGETGQTDDLRSFLAATRVLPGMKPYGDLLLRLPVYFWAGVLLLAMAALILILLRQFRSRPSTNGLQHNLRVP
ncbi:MAG: hypothetical protein ACRD3T_16750 [Terriglobia bacterium]